LQVNRIVRASEGHFIAGFIEGEGHFGIVEANGGQSFRCVMSLRVRRRSWTSGSAPSPSAARREPPDARPA